MVSLHHEIDLNDYNNEELEPKKYLSPKFSHKAAEIDHKGDLL